MVSYRQFSINEHMHDFAAGLSNSGIEFFDESVAFCTITKADLPILKQIYASTREAELSMTGWTDEQKQQFIDHQFNAQHQHYQQHYADADFMLLKAGKNVLGRLYLQCKKKQLCLIDITLLPAFRQQKLGQQILTWILNYAQKTAITVTLHVENHNPAYQWYLNNGFINYEDRGVYQYLEWHPNAT